MNPSIAQYWTNNFGDKIIDCPNLHPLYSNRSTGLGAYATPTGTGGIYIGYHFLGGHHDTPWPSANVDPWISPKKLTDSSSLALVADFNMYYASGPGYAFIPHGANGKIKPYQPDDRNTDPPRPINGKPPLRLGAKGGNVGLIDGSVRWKPISQMGFYQVFNGSDVYRGNW